MNPAVLLFADGRIYFVGLILLCLGLCLSLRLKATLARKLCQILALTGVLLVLISSTPVPWGAFAVWLLSVGFGFFALSKPRFARKAEFVLGWTTLLLILLEVPYHRVPRIPVPEGGTIYVLGDSLSAGMGMGEIPWPEVLDGRVPPQVINLARPGAVTAEGLRQAAGIGDGPAVVLILLGGNDVLGGTALPEFGTALEALLRSLFEAEHTVYLVQTPTIPFQSGFTKVQRLWAGKYGVQLLPKRLLTRTLGTPGATLDGLHLSDTGHRHLAGQLAERMDVTGR